MARTPIHPGEILKDELDELGISAAELARQIEVPASWVSQIIAGRRAIAADTALRLSLSFGSSSELWMNLQQTWELDLANSQAAIHRTMADVGGGNLMRTAKDNGSGPKTSPPYTAA